MILILLKVSLISHSLKLLLNDFIALYTANDFTYVEQNITFHQNGSEMQVKVPIVNDSVHEGDEIFMVFLDNVRPYHHINSSLGRNAIRCIIRNDDSKFHV